MAPLIMTLVGGSDGLTDLDEYENQTDPNLSDADNDGLLDGAVNIHGTSPIDPDTDRDEMPDLWEVNNNLDPFSAEDLMGDPDRDRIGNFYEYIYSTDPNTNTSTPLATIYLDPSSPGGDGSLTNAFNTIQDALNIATNYDIIQLADGTYIGTGNKNLTFPGLPLMLISKNGPANCVIDCEASGGGFRFQNGEDKRSVVRGVTVRNGNGPGLFFSGSNPIIQACIITENSETYGGGLYCSGASPTFQNCVIARNQASFQGGGVYSHLSNPKIENYIIVENNAPFGGGGGIYTSISTLLIQSSILWSNGPYQVFGNAPQPVITYSDVQDGWAGEGNINLNSEWIPGSYHLKANSPCIDAGDSSSNVLLLDIDRETRWDDPSHANAVSIVDMGADEFVDVDMDGLADVWEVQYFSHITNAIPTADPDGDTCNNLCEYEGGTDPTP